MRLPRISGKEVIRLLEREGLVVVRQKGSHVILKRMTEQGTRAIVVPLHNEIDRGTLLEIIRQSGMNKEEFLRLR